MNAELIFYNGRIKTLDKDFPEASAVAVRDGCFLAVGTDTWVMSLRGDGTRVVDLRGRTVVPGLNDSHIHIIREGLNYNMELRWDGVPSPGRRPGPAPGPGAEHPAAPMGARDRRLVRVSILGAAHALPG